VRRHDEPAARDGKPVTGWEQSPTSIRTALARRTARQAREAALAASDASPTEQEETRESSPLRTPAVRPDWDADRAGQPGSTEQKRAADDGASRRLEWPTGAVDDAAEPPEVARSEMSATEGSEGEHAGGRETELDGEGEAGAQRSATAAEAARRWLDEGTAEVTECEPEPLRDEAWGQGVRAWHEASGQVRAGEPVQVQMPQKRPEQKRDRERTARKAQAVPRETEQPPTQHDPSGKKARAKARAKPESKAEPLKAGELLRAPKRGAAEDAGGSESLLLLEEREEGWTALRRADIKPAPQPTRGGGGTHKTGGGWQLRARDDLAIAVLQKARLVDKGASSHYFSAAFYGSVEKAKKAADEAAVKWRHALQQDAAVWVLHDTAPAPAGAKEGSIYSSRGRGRWRTLSRRRQRASRRA